MQAAPDDPLARLAYGNQLKEAQQYAEAEVQLTKAIEIEPFYAELYLALAQILDVANRTNDALAQYRAFLERAPQSSPRRRAAESRVQDLSQRLAPL